MQQLQPHCALQCNRQQSTDAFQGLLQGFKLCGLLLPFSPTESYTSQTRPKHIDQDDRSIRNATHFSNNRSDGKTQTDSITNCAKQLLLGSQAAIKSAAANIVQKALYLYNAVLHHLTRCPYNARTAAPAVHQHRHQTNSCCCIMQD
jgi:hypothetical protein